MYRDNYKDICKLVKTQSNLYTLLKIKPDATVKSITGLELVSVAKIYHCIEYSDYKDVILSDIFLSLKDKPLNEKLKALRLFQGVSRIKFSELMGRPYASISAWEDAKRGISGKILQEFIITLYKIGIVVKEEWLIEGKGENPVLLSKIESNFAPSDSIAISKEINFFEENNKNSVIANLYDNTMLPHYIDGDVLGGILVDSFSDAIDSDCIVIMKNGKIKIRRIKKGATDTSYCLVALNEIECHKLGLSTIEFTDKIQQIAKIVWIRRAF